MNQKQFEDSPLGQALTAVRAKAAGDFKTPQHQGQRGQDWDNGLIAACRVVQDFDPDTKTRQSIVDNLAALVKNREEDRKQRRLKLGDPVTEAIKEIARGIAERKY